MTHNQIDYQSLQETKRHNLEMESQGRQNIGETVRHNMAYEAETNRSNLVNEGLRSVAQAETERSNRANENLKHESNILNYNATMAGIKESARHNKATEAETSRANKMNEQITYAHNVNVENETNRHNVSVENETLRHNVANENQQAFVNATNYTINSRNADARTMDAATNRWRAPFSSARDVGSALNSITGAGLNWIKSVREAVNTAGEVFELIK